MWRQTSIQGLRPGLISVGPTGLEACLALLNDCWAGSRVEPCGPWGLPEPTVDCWSGMLG